jgi:hypothetical protein
MYHFRGRADKTFFLIAHPLDFLPGSPACRSKHPLAYLAPRGFLVRRRDNGGSLSLRHVGCFQAFRAFFGWFRRHREGVWKHFLRIRTPGSAAECFPPLPTFPIIDQRGADVDGLSTRNHAENPRASGRPRKRRGGDCT